MSKVTKVLISGKVIVECNLCGQSYKILQGGRWWPPSSLGYGEFCESTYARGLSMHWKCSNYALTNLLFDLCRSIWIIDLLVICFNPHPEFRHALFTFEVLWTKECTSSSFSFVFIFRFAFESCKQFGGV